LHKESDINPEDISKKKIPVETNNVTDFNEKDFEDDKSGADLDIPGSELDDAQEKIGSEDEENNHYSIGGDNHNDLEENTGDRS
jgi:cobalamin biosynthesis protein CobT